jgi:hypothetical protein
MILDTNLQFSDAEALTSGATTGSANVIDLGAIRDLGEGEKIAILVQVTTALAGVGTCQVLLQTDDNASFSSATTVQTLGTFAATAAAGTKIVAYVAPTVAVERYVRLAYVVGTVSAGAVDAFLLHGVDNYRSYADAITIS